ncbi:MAG: integral rane protein [Candidatus Paceibacter sp.]|jgi:hypothetical protein|nr:integral rane protein [Candidatus Paceibacter sp.]
MTSNIQPKDDQNIRYSSTIIVFLILVGCAGILFQTFSGYVPTYIEPYDLIILMLATFRLIRLFTYDQIMRVVRDMFLDHREFVDPETNILMVERTKPSSGSKRALGDLFGCPWCMGMWVSFFVVVLYFAFPPARFLALILALAGAASAFQIVMNGVGAKAELYRKENNLHN